MVRCVLAIATGVGALLSCASPSPTARREVSGYVSDERSGAPLGGATVRFTSDTLYTTTGTTSSDGSYRLVVQTDVAFGQVRASFGGYRAAERTVYFDVEERRIDIPLRME